MPLNKQFSLLVGTLNKERLTVFVDEGSKESLAESFGSSWNASIRVDISTLHQQVMGYLLSRKDDLLLSQDAELNNGSIFFGPSVEGWKEVWITGKVKSIAQ